MPLLLTGHKLKKSKEPSVQRFLKTINFIVAGPFVQELKCESRFWRASSNQTIHFLNGSSEEINENNYRELFKDLKGILVAPGFGDRGINGKIIAARYARENNVPFFGVCLGLQCAVVEFARNVLGLTKAHSTEMEPKTPEPVIDLMEEQKGITEKGGTMRLGGYPCSIKENTKVFKAYKKKKIIERHRHRWEFNNQFLKAFESAGMIAAGINPGTNLVEIMEIQKHKWFIGVQFHPEYSSTVLKPHPLFVDFIKSTTSR